MTVLCTPWKSWNSRGSRRKPKRFHATYLDASNMTGKEFSNKRTEGPRLKFLPLICSPSHNNRTSYPKIKKKKYFRVFQNWQILNICCTKRLRGRLHDRDRTCIYFQNDIIVRMWKKWHVPSAYCVLQRAYCWLNVQCKGKAIPVQAWTDPEDSLKLRLQDFTKIGTRRW